MDEMWKMLIYRIRAFNSMTGDDKPDLYLPKYPPSKEDTLRLRDDMDSIVQEYKIIGNECSFRYYMTTRYLLETIPEHEIKSNQDES